MKLKYKGKDKAVWKEFVISEKDVGICDIGDEIMVRVWNTVSRIPVTLRYKSLTELLKDWGGLMFYGS